MEIAENYSKEVCMNVRDERVIFFYHLVYIKWAYWAHYKIKNELLLSHTEILTLK